MDRLEAMSAFVSVAEHRGFAEAARRLKLSPSAVTRLVGALEDRLGTRLLQRTTRSVTLTDAGARFLERARRILADVAEAEGAAQAERSAPSGRFVVTAPIVFGRLHVAPLFSSYLARYPAVLGELSLSDRVVSLVEDGIDAAVRIGSLEDASHVARQVGATRRVVVASPKFLARHKKLRTPQDLASCDTIQLTALTSSSVFRFLVDGEEKRVPVRPRYVTNSVDAALGHAELGGGVTTALGYQVREAVRAGRLRVLFAELELAPLPIHVVFPTTRLLSAKVRAFVDFVGASTDWRFLDF